VKLYVAMATFRYLAVLFGVSFRDWQLYVIRILQRKLMFVARVVGRYRTIRRQTIMQSVKVAN